MKPEVMRFILNAAASLTDISHLFINQVSVHAPLLVPPSLELRLIFFESVS